MNELEKLLQPGIVAYHLSEFRRDPSIVIFKAAERQYYVVDLGEKTVTPDNGPYNQILHFKHDPNGANVQPPRAILDAAIDLLKQHQGRF